jgi:predicted nucleic acid-binding protein
VTGTAPTKLSEQRAGEALEDWSMLRINRYPHETFLRRVWQLRHNLTAEGR